VLPEGRDTPGGGAGGRRSFFVSSTTFDGGMDMTNQNKRKVITDPKELAKAIEQGQDTIEIEGRLKDRVIVIKGRGKVAWAIVIGGVAVAITALVVTGGAAAPAAGFGLAPTVVAILGPATAWMAITMAVAAGGVGVLNKLRRYEIVEKTPRRVVLKIK
jgi:hypothetical protein